MSVWHTKTAEETLKLLKTDPRRGLSEEEAARRLEEYGPNRLEGKKRESLFRRLLDQLRDPMILVLLAAAGLSLWSSHGEDWLDAAIILLIVAVNAVISISQEENAEKALEALKRMTAPQARVVRNGKTRSVEAAGLVPGDLIVLEAGDLVPADARILDAAQCRTDESAMTGESVPVEKGPGPALPEDTPLAERATLLIGSTVVTAGRATAVIVATGMASEVGKVAGLLLDQEEGETPLQRKMGEVSKGLSFLCLCVCAVMFGVGLLEGRELMDMFLTAVSLAVAAIPEGLPAIVTIVLALGVNGMAKRGAIVKRLPAVETLGCAGVICSDKTGTLTQNRMTVTHLWPAPGAEEGELLTAAALCSDARREGESFVGDPTETALVEAAAKKGLEKGALEREFPRRGEVPFDSRRKLMTTVHALPGGGFRVCVKGAPDVLLSKCRLSQAQRKAALDENDRMAAQALRVLAVAQGELERLPGKLTAESLEKDLRLLGLVGMIDPPRPEAKAAVEQCRSAGIRPVMITGDHKLTAVAIAKELGIFREGDRAATGADLDFMPQEMLEREVGEFTVYARVSPEHKTRIVNAWRKQGKVVAMTGDGVNDAPALKAADIGCAMGRAGTDVAKEAADMILTDDDFATIVHAVAEGRGIYANIKKAIHYLLSCNIGEILTILIATVFNFRQMPLLPVQLLWLNLVTDSLPALALGVEPVEDGVMEERPRDARESLFTRGFTLRLAWQGTMVGLLTLAAYLLGEYVVLDAAGTGAGANTMAFATLTLCQLFHAFDVRSEERSLRHIGVFSNPAMNRAFAVGLVMQLSVLCLPALEVIFHTVPLTPGQWAAVLGLALTPVAVCEIVKAVKWGKKTHSHPAD